MNANSDGVCDNDGEGGLSVFVALMQLEGHHIFLDLL